MGSRFFAEASEQRLAAVDARPESRPKLVFVYGRTCGRSRRVEAFVAQVLQHRQNHATFQLVRVCAESQPELVRQLGIAELPTLLVIDERKVAARVERPHGRREIEATLSRWLK
jgi:thioredoxin-like negative regulator of GroEL